MLEGGERLEIELTLLFLVAGRAVLEVREGTPVNGRPTLHLSGNLVSSKWVDTFYPVDSTIESHVDKQSIMPYKFLLHMVESTQIRETSVSFDSAKNKASLSKTISKGGSSQTETSTAEYSDDSRDIFSALFLLRTLDYELEKKEMIKIFENGKTHDVEVLPILAEKVDSPLGVFPCLKIKVGEFFIWLSDDMKKYIVKFEAKTKMGTLGGMLVSKRDSQ
jgi:hypothetical protein